MINGRLHSDQNLFAHEKRGRIFWLAIFVGGQGSGFLNKWPTQDPRSYNRSPIVPSSVDGMSVFTVGGMITFAARLATIVPLGAKLTIEP
jgi:hypothetical protein